jgi:hypothetical protein
MDDPIRPVGRASQNLDVVGRASANVSSCRREGSCCGIRSGETDDLMIRRQ